MIDYGKLENRFDFLLTQLAKIDYLGFGQFVTTI